MKHSWSSKDKKLKFPKPPKSPGAASEAADMNFHFKAIQPETCEINHIEA